MTDHRPGMDAVVLVDLDDDLRPEPWVRELLADLERAGYGVDLGAAPWVVHVRRP